MVLALGTAVMETITEMVSLRQGDEEGMEVDSLL